VIRVLSLGMVGVANRAVGILVANYLLVALSGARIVAAFFWFVRGDQSRAASARIDSARLIAHWTS